MTKSTCQKNKMHHMVNSSEYQAYSDAKQRCVNPKHKSWKNYGGRGIQFKFGSFKEFFRDIGYKPLPHLTLDRIDNNGHYEIGNVRWATWRQQALNQRISKRPTGARGTGFQPNQGTRCWSARIVIKGKRVHLGNYFTEQQAHAAYQEAKQKADIQ